MQNQKTIRKFVRQEILKEAGKGMMRKRKTRVWKANETETNAGRYDGTNPDHRQKLAQDLYRNMTQAQEGFSSPRISQLSDGQEIIWKKRFENGMLLEVFTSVKFEPDVVMHNGQKYGKPQKSGRTFRFAPRAKGRVYYRLSYTIPGGYARVAGVPQSSQMTYSFTSTPVNRTGTFAQIIARINAGIGGLEQFAGRIWKPAAFFSRVAKGFETVESIEAQMTQALPGRQSMAQEV